MSPRGVILVRGYDDSHAVSTTTMNTTSCDMLSRIELVMSAGGSVVGVARRSYGTLLSGARLSLAQRAIGFDIGPGELPGHVLANGNPLLGALLAVMSNQGRTKGINSFYPVTNRDGEYHLEVIPVGAYLVTLFGMKQSDGVHVKSGEVATLDLNVAPWRGPKKKLPPLGDFRN